MKFRSENDKIGIYGKNPFDNLRILIIGMVTSVIILTTTEILFGSNKALLYTFINIVLLTALRQLMTFSITLTSNTFILRKLFCGIPYFTIKQEFDTVLFNEKVPILYFQDKDTKVEVENFEGFEIDCLLIKSQNKEYEIGKKNNADIIFKFIIDGLDKLKVTKVTADIGYVGRT